MIIQNQPDGSLIMIGQSDHSRLSGVFAAHWGNDSFKRPEPFESVVRAAMGANNRKRSHQDQLISD
jgi:hypothetical protein